MSPTITNHAEKDTEKISAHVEIADAQASDESLSRVRRPDIDDSLDGKESTGTASSSDSPDQLTARSNKHDEALDFLSTHAGVAIHPSAEKDARLVKKIDRHLMPIMTGIYFLQLMDKNTLAFASVFGFSRDTGLVGNQYSLLSSAVFIAQLIAQPISAFFIVKFRLSIYVPVIVTCWGATLTCMAAARNFPGLLVARFFLGGFEASIQAAFIITTQIWYRRQEQGLRTAIWYSNNGWVNIFGSLIMFGIGHIKSSVLHTYQVVFLLLGSITFLVGLVAFWVFPDNPVRCKFLSTEEKVMTIERIRANQQGLETKEFKFAQALEMILDIKSWCWMALMFLTSVPGGAINSFGPLIMSGFGFDKYTVMLLMIPFGVMQVIVLFAGFWASQRFRMKSPIMLVGLLMSIVATVMLLVVGRADKDQPALLAAFYLLASYNILTPIIINWQAANVAGHTKKSASAAFMLAGLISGDIVGPLLFSPKEKPEYHRGILAMLACFVATAALVGFTVPYLWYLNKRNEKRRVAKGKAEKMIDYSMLNAKQAEKQRLKNPGVQATGTGNQAFEDLTDLQNDEFIYLY